MLGMAMNSAKLFLQGKLFQDNSKMMGKLALGAGMGAIVIVVAGQFLPLWAAALAGGAVSGLVQPVLFKDLKYV